jgi:hypothetical protein
MWWPFYIYFLFFFRGHMLTFGGKKRPGYQSEEETTLHKMYRKRGERIEQLERELAAVKALLRCSVTNKLCGTDTWFVGYSCQCASCQVWLAAIARSK